METRRSSAGWVAVAALGLGLLMACLDSGSDPEWAGIIRDACGPAGGPAIVLRVEEGPSAGCPDPLMPDTVPALHRLLFEDLSLDSLKPGVAYRDSGVLCWEECFTPSHWTLTVESVSRGAIRGGLEVTEVGPDNIPHKSRGTVELQRCPRGIQLCH
jgi:hypothetical protein